MNKIVNGQDTIRKQSNIDTDKMIASSFIKPQQLQQRFLLWLTKKLFVKNQINFLAQLKWLAAANSIANSDTVEKSRFR